MDLPCWRIRRDMQAKHVRVSRKRGNEQISRMVKKYWDGIISTDEGLQLAAIEIPRMDCINDTTHKVSAYSRVRTLSFFGGE